MMIPIGIQLFAQSKSIYEEGKREHPDKMAIYLEHARSVEISLSNRDSLEIISEDFFDMLHLNQRSNVFAEDKVFSSHFVEIQDLEAKTLVPQKNKYNTLEVENFETRDARSDGVFFDDSKLISFYYPGITPGARSILKVRKRYRDPRFLTAYHFASFIPVEKSVLRITVDPAIKFSYKLFNTDEITIDFKEYRKGDKKVYTWTAENIKSFSSEKDAPDFNYFSPHIIYFIEEVSYEGKNKAVLSNLDDLYKMYAGFVDKINREDNRALRQLVDSLVAEEETEDEKVRKIFYWVQDNIKYIAFENGMRGFIPHDAAVVCEKRYGDCKDMASITQKMLQMAGIKSYLTWIGTRDLPYRYTELPTPQVDNHMITTYEKNGEFYFLDATSKYTAFGLPSSMIQGKEALIGVGKDEYLVKTVPIIEKEKNYANDSSFFKIAGDELVGGGKLSLDGYRKVFNSYKIIGLDKKAEKDFVVKLLKRGSNKFFVDHYEIINLHTKDKPLEIEYQYRLRDYFNEIDEEIYINLNLDKSFFNEMIDVEKRDLPKESEFRHQDSHKTFFQVPEHYKLTYLPDDVEYEDEKFGFKISYKHEGDLVVQTKTIYINYLLLGEEYFEKWNQAIKKLNQAYREVLILRKETR